MSEIRYQSAANVRKRAHNVNDQLYGDDEINGIIDRWSVNAHIAAGRALTSPWVDGTDDLYEVVRTYVLNAAACEILAGLEIDDQGKCEKAAAEALEVITTGGGTGTSIAKAGFDIVRGLDEDIYSQEF